MKEEPLISIIIPVYNRAVIIAQTLKSIVNQGYINWECLVIDDGSTDNTAKTVTEFSEKDIRIKYFNRPKTITRGANSCRNYGYKLSKGKFVNWFDSDDIMHPEFLDSKLSAFYENTNAVLHRNKYANYKLTRFRKSKFAYKRVEDLFYDYALENIEIQTCSMMWKRNYLENKELFDNRIERFQDNDFHLRMLFLQPKVEIINTVLATIRGGNGDKSQISSATKESKKKLYDIFYVRCLALKLSKVSKYSNDTAFNKQLSKKVLWAYYNFLKFESGFVKRLNTFKNSANELSILYRNNDLSSYEKLKSTFYLIRIVLY